MAGVDRAHPSQDVLDGASLQQLAGGVEAQVVGDRRSCGIHVGEHAGGAVPRDVRRLLDAGVARIGLDDVMAQLVLDVAASAGSSSSVRRA